MDKHLLHLLSMIEGEGGGGGGTGGKPAEKPAEKPADGKEPEDDDEPLGEPGKKALDAEKTKRRELSAELRTFKELGLTPEQIRALAAQKPADPPKPPAEGEQKPAVDADAIKKAAREEARREAAAEALQDKVRDKIEAKAAKEFADGEDAMLVLLRSHKIEDFLDVDNKVDAEAIADALKKLGEKKPHLLAQGKRFQGGSDGGARPPASKRPGSLSEAVNTKFTNR